MVAVSRYARVVGQELSAIDRHAGSATFPSMSELEIPFFLTSIPPANRRECKKEVFTTVSVRSTARRMN